MKKRNEGSKIKIKIFISSIISIIFVISIAFVTKKFLDEFNETESSITKLINTTGKQRMLTQKIMILIQSVNAKNLDSATIIKSDLLSSIQEMKKANEIIMNGSPKENILKITNSEIERILNNKVNLYKRINEYTNLAEENAKKNDYSEFLLEYNIYKMNSLLLDLEKLSKLYANESDLQSRKISALSIIMIISYLITSIISLFFIFKPLANHIANLYLNLEKKFHENDLKFKMLEIESKFAEKCLQDLYPRVEYNPSFNTDLISLAAFSQSAKELGKDWWGIYEFGKIKVILIGDVFGHDKGTTIVIDSITKFFENAIDKKALDKINFLDVFKHLNQTIQELGIQNQLTLTMSILVLDDNLNRVKFINAGHSFPYLVEYNEKDEIKISRFKSKGHSLGVKQNNSSLAEEEIKITEYEFKDTAMILLFTAGIVNNKDKFEKDYSEKNLKKVFEKNNFKDKNALYVLDIITSDAFRHYDSKHISEDITCIVIKRT
ncbi:SpoIIE family protein phosphatase [Pigmentibacter sp. JX0631]|uniref:PP2C family protein-serine/threonine phosphatase n=1 Tax=Pigmentibacter sp. JX0631 TaxID=2976982 RepID=UPI0024692D50|nr:SpoIIE family protein phosphatase [Pigmentibacter sp. JX0631]WGL59331.1 SpoIIE family protein phosphatase [Pigmentibacter sp. JX0631]